MARPGFTDNLKTKRAIRLLGISRPQFRGHMEMLWDVVYEKAEPLVGTVEDVEEAAEWKGTAGEFCAAILNCGGKGKHGFIEEHQADNGDTVYLIHHLFENCPEYVKKRAKRKDQREAAGHSISEMRSKSALKRWANHKKDGMQSDANGRHLHTNGMQAAANGRQAAASGQPPEPAPEPTPLISLPDGKAPSWKVAKGKSTKREAKLTVEQKKTREDFRAWFLQHGFPSTHGGVAHPKFNGGDYGAEIALLDHEAIAWNLEHAKAVTNIFLHHPDQYLSKQGHRFRLITDRLVECIMLWKGKGNHFARGEFVGARREIPEFGVSPNRRKANEFIGAGKGEMPEF